MAKNNNRYIQFYTPGTAAVKVAVQDEQTWAPLPEPKPETKISIYVDPVAIIGFAVSVCMLFLMVVGVNQLNATRREVATLEHYVAKLTAENNTLEETYIAAYKPEKIRREALELGMVPAVVVPESHIYVTLPPVPVAEEVTLWSQVTTYLTSFFA